MLEEAYGGLAVVLWQFVRDVRLWSQTDEEEREALFAEGAAARMERLASAEAGEAGLVGAFRVLASLPDSAGRERAEEIARACNEISEWATSTNRHATALDWAQAAALVSTESAPDSLRVGRLARRTGEHARAETWLRRTVTVARQTGDWSSYAAALLELGRVYVERNNRRSARRFLVRAVRAAARRGLVDTRRAAIRELRALA